MPIHTGDYVSLFDDNNRVICGIVESIDAAAGMCHVRISADKVRDVPLPSVCALGVHSASDTLKEQQRMVSLQQQQKQQLLAHPVSSSFSANHPQHHQIGQIVVGEGAQEHRDTTSEETFFRHGVVSAFVWQLIAPLAALLQGQRGPYFSLAFVLLCTVCSIAQQQPDLIASGACEALSSSSAMLASSPRIAALGNSLHTAIFGAPVPKRSSSSPFPGGVLTGMCAARLELSKKAAAGSAAANKQKREVDEMSRRFADALCKFIYCLMLCLLLSVPSSGSSAQRWNVSPETYDDIQHALLLDDDDDERDDNNNINSNSNVSFEQRRNEHLIASVFAPDIKLTEFFAVNKGFLLMHVVIIAACSIVSFCCAFQIDEETGDIVGVQYRSSWARTAFATQENNLVAVVQATGAHNTTLEVWLLSSIAINSAFPLIGMMFGRGKKKK